MPHAGIPWSYYATKPSIPWKITLQFDFRVLAFAYAVHCRDRNTLGSTRMKSWFLRQPSP